MPASPQQLCESQSAHYQLLLQNSRHVQDYLDAPEVKTLAHDRLHHCAPRGVPVTSTMRGAECRADNRLVRYAINFCIPLPLRNRPRAVKAFRKTAKLKNSSQLKKFELLLDEKFQDGSIPPGDSIEKRSTLKDAIIAD